MSHTLILFLHGHIILVVCHTQSGPRAQSALRVTLLWADKTPTRLPESVWLRFGAAADAIAARKAGAWVDAGDVLGNGSTHLHGLWADVRLQRGQSPVASDTASSRPSSADSLPSSSSFHSAAAPVLASASAPTSPRLEISSPHAAVVSVGRALDKLGAYPTPFAAADPRAGVAFSLVNNLWGTNYIMWYPFAEEDAVTAFDFDVRFF